MIIFFLLTIGFINNIFAKNQAIGFYIKDSNLGGRVIGLIFSYIFFIATISISYKINQNILLNTLFFLLGSVINYFLYTKFYNFYIRKYLGEYNENKLFFLLKHKRDFLEKISENFKLFELEKENLQEVKKLRLVKGGIIGDSLLLPYEFLKREKAKKRYIKYGLRQSFFDNFGITSDDSDHLIITYQTLKNTNNVLDFQRQLANKLKCWYFSFPIGIGLTTMKAIIKLLLGFPPNKSGINALGNGPLMRLSIVAACFNDNKVKRDNYIHASTEITHNNSEAIKITQLLGNVIAYIYKYNVKPDKQVLINLLKYHESELISKYIKLLINNIDNDIETFLTAINSTKQITGYIMTSSIFIIYVLYNAKNYKEAFEMIIKASGDTDTVGAVIGSMFAILDDNIFKDRKLNYILLTHNGNIIQYSYFNNLIKNLVSIPIIVIHIILRLL